MQKFTFEMATESIAAIPRMGGKIQWAQNVEIVGVVAAYIITSGNRQAAIAALSERCGASSQTLTFISHGNTTQDKAWPALRETLSDLGVDWRMQPRRDFEEKLKVKAEEDPLLAGFATDSLSSILSSF